ncbi:MAG: sugar porter family MFS transporter [Flavitalea sp.]
MKKQFQLTAISEGWFVSSALIGCIVGVAFSGELSDRFGRKKLLLFAALLFFISACACTLTDSLFWIIAARIVAGIGIGVASIIVPLYISEISPAAIRGRLVTFYQLAVTIGILFAYLSNAFLLNYSTAHQHTSLTGLSHFLYITEVWRGMFSVLIVPSLLFFIGLLSVPESPRWLMLKGREEEALNTMEKISGDKSQSLLDLAAIKKNKHSDSASYGQLLDPGMRRALLIGLMLPFLSQLSGINAIIYYGPTILHNAGITMRDSLFSQIIFGAAIVLFTFIAIFKVDNTGRRRLYLIGTIGATLSLFTTGLLFCLGYTSGIGLLVSVLVFLASFAFSIGPLKFVVASEIFPGAIRGRAMALSIMVMWVADTIVGQLTPISLDKLGIAGTFWFFAFFCFVGFLFILKYLPETKGKSLEEIEDYWKGVH